MSAASADPSTIAVVLGTLYQVATKGGHAVPTSPLEETFESIVARHAPRAEGSEVAWALWGALAWAVPLNQTVAAAVSEMEDNIVALLALDLEARGLFPAGSLNKKLWTDAVSQIDAVKNQNWLLAYEATQQGWLNSSAVVHDPVFSAMLKAGVSFYDRTRNVPQFPDAAHGLPGGRLADFYA